MDKWQKQKKTEILRKKIFSIFDYECYHPEMKKTHIFSVIETSDWVNVIAETEDGKILFIRQHRLGTDEITMEVPAGLVEPGEKPEAAAARELLEETGYISENISLMKKMAVNPAIMNNYVYFFLAENCRKVDTQSLDESEDIEVFTVDKNRIREMISGDMINHQVICSALLFYLGNFNAPD